MAATSIELLKSVPTQYLLYFLLPGPSAPTYPVSSLGITVSMGTTYFIDHVGTKTILPTDDPIFANPPNSTAAMLQIFIIHELVRRLDV